jgi:hypothetical protein
MHAEVPVVAPDGTGRLPGIELDGIETLAGDAGLRFADENPAPVFE